MNPEPLFFCSRIQKAERDVDAMSAYLLVDNEITDQALFAEYARDIVAVTAAHDDRYLVRGGPLKSWRVNGLPTG